MPESLNVLRLAEDSAGASHFDSYDMALALKSFAPPALPFFASSVGKACGYVVIRIPVGWIGEPHPSPNRQILFCLSGALKVTAVDGAVRTVKAGETWLMEDTRNGHESEVVSDVPFDAAIVILPEADDP